MGDVFVTATGNIDVITIDHMRHMKDRAIVCNIGHFDRENPGRCVTQLSWEEVKPPLDKVVFPDGKRLIALAAESLGAQPGSLLEQGGSRRTQFMNFYPILFALEYFAPSSRQSRDTSSFDV